jgi:predicted ATPase
LDASSSLTLKQLQNGQKCICIGGPNVAVANLAPPKDGDVVTNNSNLQEFVSEAPFGAIWSRGSTSPPKLLPQAANFSHNQSMSIIARLCICISGYRSLREVRLELGPFTVVTGANGSGKSSLYRALRLLADIAQGRIIHSLALEGGLPSALWAGPETFSRSVRQGIHPVQGTVRKGPVSLKLGFSSEDYGYAIDLGVPPPIPRSRFHRDPEIKLESLWIGLTLQRANAFAERVGPQVKIRDKMGAWRQVVDDLQTYDSMLTHCGDPRGAPGLLDLRESMRSWRFYDHFRTDSDAPARRRQVGTRTPVLASDGSDLAAAIGTIQEIGAHEQLDAAVAAVDDPQ